MWRRIILECLLEKWKEQFLTKGFDDKAKCWKLSIGPQSNFALIFLAEKEAMKINMLTEINRQFRRWKLSVDYVENRIESCELN